MEENNIFEIAIKLFEIGHLFDGDQEPVSKEAAMIDKKINKKLDEFTNDVKKHGLKMKNLDALKSELKSLHELRQMMELASDDGAGDGGEETC